MKQGWLGKAVKVDWDSVARAQAANGLPEGEAGPHELYTQTQCLTAFVKGVEKGRQPSEWKGDGPLILLQTDLWTESVARSRQLLNGALHLAWEKGYFTTYSTTYAMDVSRVTCLMAASGTDAHIVQADIRGLPFQRETFDLIFDPSTIDHVPFEEAVGVLGQYSQCLRPGGIAVLIFSHQGGTLQRDSGETYFVFSPSKVKAHLRQLGFETEGEYAICCLNTQPAGILTSKRLHLQRLAFALFAYLEYAPLSHYFLGRLAPLYVVIGRKKG
jgi:SAM-dependent methyltransferase